MIYQGKAFNGKPTKTTRSHGRYFRSRSRRKPLGSCRVSETQVIEPDANKACKKLANIKCMVEVLLKWLEGMEKNLFKAKIQVGFRGEASVGDAYNQIWFVKSEEKMKLLKKHERSRIVRRHYI
ncbi:LOW QUALITY PROTEIN: uncharacterized protein LOC9308088 [Arabidopsis lyrata subsp. lyrata]|uniref:LOW QUALITY PROTEIN: uncharacterized protein LOC9308088 n=1 Tax=Arabidopsis lyrata subsp. lyrata TaxID=81972 RepID=UPI000A29D893|nr:LOW QUALITY PROTEIN: uncharacterized protein LOC9308088 [Arabidopsis lyrata subsp. lyrata]|eukprot:XP_020879529.1 LOW QUALITY PROTEIN: uncharacterized protein LOC9308088 [Arabidopsis lyrata subsp. lyrata]